MIKEALDVLEKKDRDRLLYAFENGFSLYVELPKRKFVGVNLRGAKQLAITEQTGDWAYGVLKDYEVGL